MKSTNLVVPLSLGIIVAFPAVVPPVVPRVLWRGRVLRSLVDLIHLPRSLLVRKVILSVNHEGRIGNR